MKTLILIIVVTSFLAIYLDRHSFEYKYEIGDCIGVGDTVLGQVTDRRGGFYFIDQQPTEKEVTANYPMVSRVDAESGTEKVTCPKRAWR